MPKGTRSAKTEKSSKQRLADSRGGRRESSMTEREERMGQRRTEQRNADLERDSLGRERQ